ncbi:hypothetical protein ATO2_05285 [Roseovarius sp. 22II1-1F6A]|nr:hypothetical protein ATO2_05285 [Roseovarius sp. 22II1-1F6A]
MFKRIALFLRHRGRHQLLRGVLDHPDLAGLGARALADMPIPWPAPSDQASDQAPDQGGAPVLMPERSGATQGITPSPETRPCAARPVSACC